MGFPLRRARSGLLSRIGFIEPAWKQGHRISRPPWYKNLALMLAGPAAVRPRFCTNGKIIHFPSPFPLLTLLAAFSSGATGKGSGAEEYFSRAVLVEFEDFLLRARGYHGWLSALYGLHGTAPEDLARQPPQVSAFMKIRFSQLTVLCRLLEY